MSANLFPLDSFLRSALEAPVPEASLEVMRLCALDWAMCGMGALRDPIAASMVQHASSVGAGRASVFFAKDVVDHGGADRLPVRDAALINGTISHALDFDDTHFGHIGHVSTVVLPAALAVAEDIGADFDTFIKAARIGAEVACRVGLWLGRSHYQAGWHQTATAGANGAASAAAVLMGAHPMPTLQNVAGMAAGLKAQFGSPMKPVNAGQAAANGVEAAQLACAGMTGSAEVFDAVLEMQAGEGNVHAFDDLGTTWMFDTVSHKYDACCHGTHAMIEALRSLGPINAGDVDSIDIATNPRWMSVCNKPDPTTWLEGKFSYSFLAALVICKDTTIGAGPELYFPLDGRTAAHDIMQAVTVRDDDTVAETACDLRVTLKSGAMLGATHDLAAPEPLDVRRAKLLAKGEALLLPPTTLRIAAAIDARDLAAFTQVLRGDGA